MRCPYPYPCDHLPKPIPMTMCETQVLSRIIWVRRNSNIPDPAPVTLQINLLRAVRANGIRVIRCITRRERIGYRGYEALMSTPVFLVLVPMDLGSSKRPPEALTLRDLLRVAQLGHAWVLASVIYGGGGGFIPLNGEGAVVLGCGFIRLRPGAISSVGHGELRRCH